MSVNNLTSSWAISAGPFHLLEILLLLSFIRHSWPSVELKKPITAFNPVPLGGLYLLGPLFDVTLNSNVFSNFFEEYVLCSKILADGGRGTE